MKALVFSIAFIGVFYLMVETVQTNNSLAQQVARQQIKMEN